MPQVDFARLSPDQYEKMVAVLLSRVRQTHRVDGRGGDGGVDCSFSDEDGTDVYELKSFTGRMGTSQRRQVKRSLARAMAGSPRSWTLVVPIDPNPAEESWFDTLRAGHEGTRMEWLGENWLIGQLARCPDITRYFAGAAEEVVRLLADINREDALPGDALGLARKFVGQAARLNEIDPYYTFGFTVVGETVTVTAHPRYPDAPRDRPITVTATLKFDESPGQQEVRAAFEDYVTFGTPVTIPPTNISSLTVDAPAGMGGEFHDATLRLDGMFQPGPGQETSVLLRVPSYPPVRQMLSLEIAERSSGGGGLRLLARDKSGLLTLELRVDFTQRTCQAGLAYRYHGGALPQDAVPVLRLCAELAAQEELAVTDPAGQVIAVMPGSFGPVEAEAYIRCAELLAEVQSLSGTAFPLPAQFTSENQQDLLYARAILRGETVPAEWSTMTVPLAAPAVNNLLLQIDQHGEQFVFAVAVPEAVVAAGGQIPVGTVMQFLQSVRVTNLAEVRAWRQGDPGGTFDVQFEPGESRSMTIRSAPPVREP